MTTSAALAPALRIAAAEYTAKNPSVRVLVLADGSDVAMAWLYSGRADVAVLGRDVAEHEVKAYQWVYGYPPSATPLARGSVASPGHSPDLAVRVHASSPIRALTIMQLREMVAIGGKGRLILPNVESGTGRYLRAMLRDGAPQFDWHRVTEVAKVSDAQTADAIARAVAADRTAIGFGDARPMAGTRIVPIDGALPGDAVYPLVRTVIAYADPKPQEGAKGFIAFLSSDAGQAVLTRAGWRRP